MHYRMSICPLFALLALLMPAGTTATIRHNQVARVTEPPSHATSQVAASSTGAGKIVFAASPNGIYGIYVMYPDGSNMTHLPNTGYGDANPSWSPDGTRIAFTFDRNIYVINADGSNRTKLTTNGFSEYNEHPAWSPDGTRIAFSSTRDARNYDIYVMNADGSNQIRLTAQPGPDGEPAWSPDGQRIAFSSERDSLRSDIYVMNVDGSNQIKLPTDHLNGSESPAWSPDGTRITFAASTSFEDWRASIYVMDANGSRITRLTVGERSNRHPTWSPDGTRIAFISSRDYENYTYYENIYVMNADGSNQTKLTTNGLYPSNPVWSPAQQLDHKTWTLMYYMAGDNDTEMETLLRYEYLMLSPSSKNPNVNVLAFWDGKGARDTQYTAWSSSGATSVEKGELNSGDPAALQDFVRWAQQNYPATYNALIISDHGSGVSGVAVDTKASIFGDYLTPKELRQALTTTSHLDILYMNACLMGTIEGGYQLRGIADYYVASEAITWGAIQPAWFTLGHKDPQGAFEISPITTRTTPQQLAVAMAKSSAGMMKSSPSGSSPSTISVAKLSAVGDVAAKTSTLAELLKSRMGNVSSMLKTMQSPSVLQHYASGGDSPITSADEYVDLYHFADVIESRSGQSDIKAASQQLKEAINNYIVYEDDWSGTTPNGNRWNHNNSHGVSIFYPTYSRSFYKDGWLDFATGTTWDINNLLAQQSNAESLTSIEWGPMLVDFIRQTNPTTPDNPNPPDLVAPLSSLQHIYLPVIQR